MARIQHPKLGDVSERSFSRLTLEEDDVTHLEKLKEKGAISDFLFAGSQLTLWRPWLPGETVKEFFAPKTAVERAQYSRDLFKRVSDLLKDLERGHGALHPDNLIVLQGKVEVVDRLFNNTLLNPGAIGPPTLFWLWANRMPRGWSIYDWDRASLLRTAALLTLKPTDWENELAPEEALELCGKWLAGFAEAEPNRRLKEALEESRLLLERMRVSDCEEPLTLFERSLADLESRKQHPSVLLESEEATLQDFGVRVGLNPREIADEVNSWLVLRRMRRERELTLLAGELLRRGLHGSEYKMVRARLCIAAEQVFTHHGFDRHAASERVQAILTDQVWSDERQMALRARSCCDEYTSRYLEGRAEPKSSVNHAKALAAEITAKLQYPPDVSERLAELEVERRLLDLNRQPIGR